MPFGRSAGWTAGLVGLVIALTWSQVVAIAASDGSETVADPNLPRVGYNFRISGAAALSDDWEPDVAFNPTADQYLIVWSDGRNEATRGREIYGQLLTADGARVGYNFRISGATATSDAWAPVVVYNSTSNQYFVVWSEGHLGVSGHWDIYGQRIRPNGNLAGDNVLIGGTGDFFSLDPEVAFNSTSNQYLVVWHDKRNETTRGSDIYGQRVKANGNMAGPNFSISGPSAIKDEWMPTVAYNPVSNQYLVAWKDDRDWPTQVSDIYGQRVKANGNMAGENFPITSVGATQFLISPAVAFNPTSNQYLVVWTDSRSGDTRDFEIYGQRIKGGGSLAGENFRISDAAARNRQWIPAIAYSHASNRYLVIWADERRFPTRGTDIYGQRVKGNGNLWSDNFRISGAAATGSETVSNLAYNPTGNQHLVVFDDTRNMMTRGWDIFGQLVAG